MISTPRWSLVSICSGVDEQLLVLAHQPRSCVLSLHTGHAPGDGIALEVEGAEGVLGRVEPCRQCPWWVRLVLGLFHPHVQRRVGHLVNELSVDNVELACCRVRVEDRHARDVRRLGLEVFVVVGCRDGSDPESARLQLTGCRDAGLGNGRGRAREEGGEEEELDHRDEHGSFPWVVVCGSLVVTSFDKSPKGRYINSTATNAGY